MSKTPKFDAAIGEVLKELKPHNRTCRNCGDAFPVQKEDINFYNLFKVPAPTQCPKCRSRTRRAFSNYGTFFKKKCDVPGHDETFISGIPDGGEFPVYDFDFYWSGDWSPLSFGQEYDPSKSFFSQFNDLARKVPHPASTRDPISINSEYTAYGIELKNCYYVFGGHGAENILYGNWPLETKDDVDVLIAWNSDRCYEVVYVKNCYQCRFVYFSRNCINSAFLYDCRNCEHCFGCVNLRNKKYYFFNKPLSKEEYEKKMEEINLGSREVADSWNGKFLDFLKETPHRVTFNERNVDSSGSLLEGCKNCFNCFFVIGGENLRYTELELSAKDSMDILFGTTPEKCYFTNLPYDGSDIKFSSMLRSQCQGIEYSLNLKTCKNCFGCIGLENKSFCIFNKQYSQEEYWKLVDEIKTDMLKNGEYGEFFPITKSPFPYNSSLAQFSWPVSREDAQKEKLWFQEKILSDFDGTVLSPDEVEEDIKNVHEGVLDVAISSKLSKRLFRIVKPELAFYKKENIPLPVVHPEERLRNRFKWFNHFNLETITCIRCGKTMVGMPNKEMGENIVCDECYQAEII